MTWELAVKDAVQPHRCSPLAGESSHAGVLRRSPAPHSPRCSPLAGESSHAGVLRRSPHPTPKDARRSPARVLTLAFYAARPTPHPKMLAACRREFSRWRSTPLAPPHSQRCSPLAGESYHAGVPRRSPTPLPKMLAARRREFSRWCSTPLAPPHSPRCSPLAGESSHAGVQSRVRV